MRITLDIPGDPELIEAALTGLTAVNAVLISRGSVPSLSGSGARYVKEPGSEIWQTAAQVAAHRQGDCEDLASWRAAELTVGGLPSRVGVFRGGPRLLHAIVERSDGVIEDPSARLGMKVPR